MASGAESSAGLELEKMLDHVLEQVRLATSATAAAIALKSGDEMVCRAAGGPNAPDVGVRLDVSSGLSGACVRTREIQYCADAETDRRVNAAASRRLQVRSVLVVPLEAGDELLGVFEIFSPHPGAFGNRDLQNLQTLSQVIVENLRELWAIPQPAVAVDLPSATIPIPAPQPAVPVPVPTAALSKIFVDDEPRFAWPTGPLENKAVENNKVEEAEKEKEPSPPVVPAISGWPTAKESAVQAETPVRSRRLPGKIMRGKRTREWGTSLLTAAVITVAVILGWTVGRPGWQRVTRKQSSASPPASSSTDSSEGRTATPPQKSNEAGSIEPANQATTPSRASAAQRDDSSGGLVIYQNGKVIFRQSPRSWPAGQPSAQLKTDAQPAEKVATVFLSPLMASARLIQRIEPVYPEAALQTHVQGEVELEALVGKDGSVQQLKLLSGDPELAAAAADAIRHWRFRPYQSDGQFVEFSTRLSVDFRLP